jgi:uncharacterized repeat protein (TIGR03847 family)
MTDAVELLSPDRFTAGTVGPPGQRVFYLQGTEGGFVVSVRCEKQQVAALAEYLDGLLDDLGPVAARPTVGDLGLLEPIDALWAVGSIGVAYDEPADQIIVVLEELTGLPDEDDESEPSPGGSVKLHLTRSQVAAFVGHSRALVAAGRPPCRFCGLPIDSDGHACPRMN